MRYRKMDAEQLQIYYGHFAKPEKKGRGMSIPCGGKNRGKKEGKSNLKYYMEFCGVLLDKDNTETNVLMGFKIHDLIMEFYCGFSDDAIIIPGARIVCDRKTSKLRQFYVTLNPDNTNFVVIGDKRYHDKDQITKDLSDLCRDRGQTLSRQRSDN